MSDPTIRLYWFMFLLLIASLAVSSAVAVWKVPIVRPVYEATIYAVPEISARLHERILIDDAARR